MTMESARRQVEEGRYLLWVADNGRRVAAAFLTRTAIYPGKSMLVIDAAGGTDMRHWLGPGEETFRRFAKDSGLDGVEMYGRMGWPRVLRRYGWRQAFVVCEVDVTGGGDQ